MSWISKNIEVVETVLEDGAVLLNLETKFYYSMNDIGYRIWELLDVTNSIDELIQKLSSEYNASFNELNEKIPSYLISLREERLLKVSDSAINIDDKSAEMETSGNSGKKHFSVPEIIKHDEPLHEVVQNPFDPQLPLAE